MMQPSNPFGDGITLLSESVTTSAGWRWFNAFNVTSIPHPDTETIDVYPTDTLSEFFSAVRNGKIFVYRCADDGTAQTGLPVVGVVKSFLRELRGDNPNLIRVSVLFDDPAYEAALPDVVLIRPLIVGEYRGYNDPATGYKLREVTEIKGLALTNGKRHE